jgi:biopolymer transport protein ExbB
MTALGLVVAVPAVLAYNWLIRRNKSIVEELARFSNELHGYMMSGGAVRPVVANRAAGAATGGAGAAKGPGAASPGGTTATGSAIGANNPGPKKV